MTTPPGIAQRLFVFGTDAQAQMLAESLVAEGLSVSPVGEEAGSPWGRARLLCVLADGKAAAAAADEPPAILIRFGAEKADSAPPVPTVRLARWRGARDNRDFRDLLAQIRATLAIQRRRKRRFLRLIPLAMIPAILGFWANLFGVQREVCSIGGLQPNLSDICGSLGLGGKPTYEERIAWEGRPRGSCPALSAHIARFPEGAYADDAAILLAAAVPRRSETPVQVSRPITGYVRAPLAGTPAEASARRAALAAADRDAREMLCIPRDDDERLVGVRIEPGAYDCRSAAGGGRSCGLNFRGQCVFDTHPPVNHCP